jgi:hypothetical protein
MAITIMGGLFFATILTLLVVPALYAIWFRVQEIERDAAFADVKVDEFELRLSPLRIAAE